MTECHLASRARVAFTKTNTKAQALWNAHNRRLSFAAAVKDTLGCCYVTPTVTRWNSPYNSFVRVESMLTNKLAELNTICTQHRVLEQPGLNNPCHPPCNQDEPPERESQRVQPRPVICQPLLAKSCETLFRCEYLFLSLMFFSLCFKCNCSLLHIMLPLNALIVHISRIMLFLIHGRTKKLYGKLGPHMKSFL